MDIADYLQTAPVVQRGGRASLALPVLHLETLDEATVPWCRDWRAEIRMSDLDAPPSTPPVTVGAVDFVIVQLSESEGYRPIADRLAMLGVRAARFGELFEGGRLEERLEDHTEFFDGMPMYCVLLVLDAIVDDLLPPSRLRAWAVAEVFHAMLSTTSGMAVVAASGRGERPRRLAAVDHLDPGWVGVGLTTIPGHPGLLGRATLFTYLDAARTALSGVADQVLAIPGL